MLAGAVPICKHAIITPLLKKPSLDPNNFKDFHPVSNLPFLLKVFDRVLVQLLNHLSSHSVLEASHSAYYENDLTKMALL